MRKNREEYAKDSPAPYQGEVTKPATPELAPTLAHIAKGVNRKRWVSSKDFIETFVENQFGVSCPKPRKIQHNGVDKLP
jgi:hypothetical protein